MFRHKRLMLFVVLGCLALMGSNTTNVFAAGVQKKIIDKPDPILGVPQTIIKKLDQIQNTLDNQVIPKLDECTECPECPPCKAGVPRTGQTTGFGVGSDGALQVGVPLPIPRFTDNGNGTVTDNFTGLTWLKNANCFGERTWTDALNDCNTLQNGTCGLTDQSTVGSWRLTNLKELGSLLDLGHYGPALSFGHPFANGNWSPGDHYWSSTTYLPHTDQAWYVEMYNGVTDATYKSSVKLVWPVRGGN